MNHCVLIGRLATSPDLKYLNSGTAVAQFTLAVDRQTKEKGADFIRCVCWQKLAEVVANNLEKGRLVAVVGSLQVRKYETQKGEKREAVEVVAREVKFLDYKKTTETSNSGGNASSNIANDAEKFFAGKEVTLDDDIPF